MPNEENTSKFTMNNYFKSVRHFKWWVIGSTVLGALVGFLGIKFLYNKSREELQSSFGYDINLHVTSADEKNEKLTYSEMTKYFADNSIYNFSDIVSESRLYAVKESNEEYKNVNVKSILQNNAIQLQKEGYVDNQTGKTTYDYPERYTLTIKLSYFKNANQGKKFVKDLIEYELKVAEQANNSYSVPYYITDSFSNSTLKNRVDLLEKQYKAIETTYKTMSLDFSESSLVSENETLAARYNTFVQKNKEGAFNKFNQFVNEYYKYHYVIPGVDTEESLHERAAEYINNIKSLLIEIDVYDESLQKLIQTQTTVQTKEDNALIEKILELQEKIDEAKLSVFNYANELNNLGYLVPSNSADITLDNINSIVYNNDPDAEGCIQFITNSSTKKPANWLEDCTKFIEKLSGSIPELKSDSDKCTTAYRYIYNNYKNKANFYTTDFAKVIKHTNDIFGVLIGLITGYLLSSIVVMIVYVVRKEEK